MKFSKYMIIATMWLPTFSWAVCDITGTTAVSAYELSGQGNFSCNSLGMADEPIQIDETNPDGSFNWSSLDQTQDGEVDAVVVEPSSGARCVYNYGVATVNDDNLTTSNGKAVKAIFGCTDGLAGAPAATKPFSDFGEGCTATVLCDGGPCPGIENATVALIHGLDVAGVCQIAQAEPLSPFEQVECVDQCVDRIERTTGVDCAPNDAGEIPLECSRCLISEEQAPAADPSLRYCAEYTSRACGSLADQGQEPTMLERCMERTENTYRPRESLGNDGDVEHYDGTTCYKSTKTSGGKTYTYSNC